ncbi:integrase core domain-containing protein [Sediminivirga luteola]|nr:integrase core domain-containing protein [Sediminivirga luteola]MCI2267148.1 integrase core domain-containing protein [Sediminivirga luteola]
MGRYKEGGLDAVEPRSRRPHTNPKATPETLVTEILRLRAQLDQAGLDAGAESIYARLPADQRVSVSTIWRILKRHQQVDPQPQKRPRSSWHRFEAESPNQMWQSDFTHCRLADNTDLEVIPWLDDHSRYLLHISAHPRVTGATVVESFIAATDEYGLPAATLTDNGMVYTTRLAGLKAGWNTQPNGFEQLLADLSITQKNGAPGHPTTQGKIERFHQTLKRWLNAAATPENTEGLQQQLDTFQALYNHQRPHRALNRRTPATAYAARPKAGPRLKINNRSWRIRYDKVCTQGRITLRYAGKLRHLNIGRAHRGQRVLALVHDRETMVIDLATRVILAEHIIDPDKDYQPKKQ